MMSTDQITSLKPGAKVAGLKKTASTSPKIIEGNAPTDKLTLSIDAKEAIELNRFVDILRKMPEVRDTRLEKKFDFSGPTVLREVAKKIAEDL